MRDENEDEDVDSGDDCHSVELRQDTACREYLTVAVMVCHW